MKLHRLRLTNFRGITERDISFPPSGVIVLEGDNHRRVEVVSIGVKTVDKWEVIANLKPGDQILGP